MKLWRIDADHDSGDGAWTLLFRDQAAADMHAGRYSRGSEGWLIDIYCEDAGPLSPQTADRLCGVLWPVLPLAELVALANDPVPAAKQRLDELLATNSHRTANNEKRMAWEGH